MSDELVCPNCGLDEHLRGEQIGELIRITCSPCGLVWERDPSPRCRLCSGSAVRPVPQAVWEKSRGTQLSIVSMRTIYLCEVCDGDRLRDYIRSGTPLPPDENPAAGMR